MYLNPTTIVILSGVAASLRYTPTPSPSSAGIDAASASHAARTSSSAPAGVSMSTSTLMASPRSPEAETLEKTEAMSFWLGYHVRAPEPAIKMV